MSADHRQLKSMPIAKLNKTRARTLVSRSKLTIFHYNFSGLRKLGTDFKLLIYVARHSLSVGLKLGLSSEAGYETAPRSNCHVLHLSNPQIHKPINDR